MAYRLSAFSDVGLDEATLSLVLDEHTRKAMPRLDQFWTYYRNPLSAATTSLAPARDAAGPWYSQGQEAGLPPRLTGSAGGPRREIVIENDIAWRVQSMVDFIFGKPIRIASTAADEASRADAEHALHLIWEASGGIALLQDAALLGHVFGHVDLLVRVNADQLRDAGRRGPRGLENAADAIRVEAIDPRRGIPILDPSDYRRLSAYIIRQTRAHARAESQLLQIYSGSAWQEYENQRLVSQGDLRWTAGRIPVVHIQNIAQPLDYAGLGEVEPLIPIQDELNTRLSDRAFRVTMQSFKMYIARGLEGFDATPVAPGQIWSTDNPDASVESFGGDAACPSEDAHIAQLREAMDKISGLPPLAGGVVQGKVGNLSSANALRITLMSLLAKTARKRVTYGRGIAEASSLALAALDWAGILRTRPADRGVRIEWPEPLPVEERDRVLAAEGKARLGVPRDRVLAELGYDSQNASV
jgi:hypothetical protein